MLLLLSYTNVDDRRPKNLLLKVLLLMLLLLLLQTNADEWELDGQRATGAPAARAWRLCRCLWRLHQVEHQYNTITLGVLLPDPHYII